MKLMNEDRTGKGTKEWSDRSYNICRGCEHGCLYCFAKSRACRYSEVLRRPGEWQKQELNPNRSRLGAEVVSAGVVMFPSSHDITPRFQAQSIATIKNLLATNKVLLVSKPHLSVIQGLCRELARWRKDILFRFSIGSLNSELCAFWEPGAPSPQERIQALRYAFENGFDTSVSVEPMLDERDRIVKLVSVVQEYVTDSIWVGKMQRIPHVLNAHVKGFSDAVALIKAQQCDAEIMKLVESLKGNSKVRWKDSIRAVMEKTRS